MEQSGKAAQLTTTGYRPAAAATKPGTKSIGPAPAAAADDFATAFAHTCPATPVSSHAVCTLVVDAEEDFDWSLPIAGTAYSTVCLEKIGGLQSIARVWGAFPTYLLTYPVLQNAHAVRTLRWYFERGECALGLQLHTWVTPPFEGPEGIAASFSSNLSRDIEERKILSLKALFEHQFGFEPKVYRSGRYGLSHRTLDILEAHGFEVDTSVAPCTSFTSEGGPDFTDIDYRPFWLGRQRSLLELPLCRSIVGWAGGLGRTAYQAVQRRLADLGLESLLSRIRAAERITLSPEGNDATAMRRLICNLLRRQCRVFPVSFHSSSLVIGSNPYVTTRADLHRFYDRLSAILAFLADDVGCQFATLPQLPSLMRMVEPE